MLFLSHSCSHLQGGHDPQREVDEKLKNAVALTICALLHVTSGAPCPNVELILASPLRLWRLVYRCQ